MSWVAGFADSSLPWFDGFGMSVCSSLGLIPQWRNLGTFHRVTLGKGLRLPNFSGNVVFLVEAADGPFNN